MTIGKRITSKMLFLFFATTLSGFSGAAYWNEQVCSLNLPSTQFDPGTQFSASVSVSANRDETSQIPVAFYFSSTPYVNSTSTYLGATTATIYQPGNYCSAIVHKTLRVPTSSYGMNCMAGTSAYIVARAGDDEHARQISLVPGSGDVPSISGFTPTKGPVGTLVTITGDNFDDKTAVFIGGIQAAREIKSSTEILAQIPANATTNTIKVQRVGSNYNFCIPPMAVSSQSFAVLNYCVSGALADGYGRIEYIATDEFAINLLASGSCANYSNYGSYITHATLGDQKLIDIQFDSCGAPDYAKLFKAYVDWNNDGDFDDLDEYVAGASTVASDVLYQINMNIPSTASVGNARLRLITALYYSGYVESMADVSACGQYPFGETQDFNLTISDVNGELVVTLENPGVAMAPAKQGGDYVYSAGAIPLELNLESKTTGDTVTNVLPNDEFIDAILREELHSKAE